ncbi:ATP-dependent DNA helicase RecG [Acetobacter oeni]|uniref:ATP-dependent DNA helicase RecG n=1 Tax=Acetobacter oeni TaxID=304077 RepID=A0A511XMZ2_9PROT|nr:ATP-dependent DNA helicase RecG [Acetobacter oeni]MBB3881577.1 ATP-dependent DNA helicase RecG [Acetobacter oeni]NHO17604.1 ATP-dependent DNA helicase RecG [Acetobacter oeni]GBR00168.1 DNA helicase RecG [Acetobacter oeni LMG 21952]GEN64320.1 ATP-dependent DNA helicase RecG [Acetobacter oeni]
MFPAHGAASVLPPVPALVAPLLSPLAGLSGVKPATAKLLMKVCGGTAVVDLLFHMPESVIDRRYCPDLGAAEPGRVATVAGVISRVVAPAHRRQPWKVVIENATGSLEIAFFSRWQAKRAVAGAEVLVSGRLEQFGGRLTMSNPDYFLSAGGHVPALDPVWPLTAGLFGGQVRVAMRRAFALVPEGIPEWQDAGVVARHGWPDFRTALLWTHFPADDPALLLGDSWRGARRKARERLACDELLADQVATLLAREANRERPGRSLTGDGALRREALRRFGHTLTAAQDRVLGEIDGDLAAPRRMVRLLQGDVGAGKTIVALLAMLRAAEAGAQAAIMAPTEILARQHYATFQRLSPVPVVFLSGSVRGKARREALAAIADGSAVLVVGTHALVQEAVVFHDLALAIVDEQHRFGVDQRILLAEKGAAADMLVMTATPIPRSLLLAHWGEMDVSRLDVKPSGRKPIRTSVHGPDSFEDVLAGVGRALSRGAGIFWVCPLVSESETLDIAAAEARHASLTERFGGRVPVGLAHGKQDITVREAALTAFAAGESKLLVATTVIEVGVDVPDATVMVIEHAERFGLAQLHQLRGRVGRGAAESYCLLLHGAETGATARQRLALLRETEDGFLIADEDFRLRGGGDATGNRQSGLPGFRIATTDEGEFDASALLVLARQSAEMKVRAILERGRAGEAIAVLLALFGKTDFGRIIQSG